MPNGPVLDHDLDDCAAVRSALCVPSPVDIIIWGQGMEMELKSQYMHQITCALAQKMRNCMLNNSAIRHIFGTRLHETVKVKMTDLRKTGFTQNFRRLPTKTRLAKMAPYVHSLIKMAS